MGKIRGIRMRHPLAYNQINLCDIVFDVESPWNDCRSFLQPLNKDDIFPVDELNLEAIQARTGEVGIQAQLAAFLDAQAKLQSATFQKANVGRARCYRICNSTDKFKAACKDPGVREWLNKYCVKGGLPAYVIVGIYTFQGAQVGEIESRNIAAHVGGGVPGDLSAKFIGGGSQTTIQGTTFTSTDETIFAMEYRKVIRKWRSKDLSKATLEQGNSWEVFWGMRSKINVPENERKVVEMSLVDEVVEDVEESELLFEIEENN